MKTVLITGCSTGFGREAAVTFVERGWNVIATMRTPNPDVLPASDRLRILPLDVTDSESIEAARAAAGDIDVLVNNAGIGLAGVVEGTPMELVRETFETNVFGLIQVTRAFLPTLRERGAGTVINVSSSTTLKTLPLVAVYTATKAAVNAFTECLDLELAPLGVRARVVLPGQAPTTAFAANAQSVLDRVETPDAYADFVQTVVQRMLNPPADAPLTHASDVAEAIWRAATDPDCPRVLPAGADAVAFAAG